MAKLQHSIFGFQECAAQHTVMKILFSHSTDRSSIEVPSSVKPNYTFGMVGHCMVSLWYLQNLHISNLNMESSAILKTTKMFFVSTDSELLFICQCVSPSI